MIQMRISPGAIPSMVCCLLNSDLAFVIVLSVFARAVRCWLWYWASSAVIASPQCLQLLFWKSCCHFPLSGIWLVSVLAVDTLPLNLLKKKYIFNGAIDGTNLEHVLHWLMHSYVSLSLHFNTLSSFKAQVCTFLCHYFKWLLNTAPMPSLSSNLSGSMSTGREGISRNRLTFLIKLCYPEPSVGTLPLAGHRCFNFSDVTYDTALPREFSPHLICWSMDQKTLVWLNGMRFY